MAGTTKIQFDLSWENSWRGININSWDAAWVFVKYRTPAGVWNHVRLENTGHVPAGGSQIDPGLLTPGSAYNPTSNPVVGVLVYRAQDGMGSFTAGGMQLNWNYGAAGINYIDIADIQVFAVEMVYVPQGTFAAGSGGTEYLAFTLTTINTGTATTPPSGTGGLGGQAGRYPTGQTAPTSASWPNGFNAFYCMKYELSQQGYVDFLNTLTYAQQLTRTTNSPGSSAGTGAMVTNNTFRNGIDIQTPGQSAGIPARYACNVNGNGVFNEGNDGKDIACNWLSWGDVTAYMDWNGLRPMTEMEFEKACRGTTPPQANEYVWGSIGVATNAYTLSLAGTTIEGIAANYSTSWGNASYTTTDGLLDGPLRVGIFAANIANDGRVAAGATYYGIMEMGGNLFESAVNINTAEGRAFSGVHGNGFLTVDGNPDVTLWPASSTGVGGGFRGGAYGTTETDLRVSDRGIANNSFGTRSSGIGCRGVRKAP